MNNEFNRPKQINRVATPIKVDSQGNRIEPDIVKTVEKKEIKEIKEHDSTTAVFVVVLLIILACLVAFIFLYIVPKYLEAKSKEYHYNDATTTTSVFVNNILEQYTLSNDIYISNDSVFNVGDYKISLKNNGETRDILINDKAVVSADYLLPKVAIVDNLLIFVVQNKEIRTTKLLIVDSDANIVYELYNIKNNDGMVLMPDSSSIIFNSVSIVVIASRVNGNNLILDNTYGVKSGINICSSDALISHNIGDNFATIATYSFEYLGNKTFSDPTIIHSTNINEYIESNGICK